MRKTLFAFALGAALAPAALLAATIPGLDSETNFRLQHGHEAAQVAAGVYELYDAEGGMQRHSFGRAGMRWERDRAMEQLQRLHHSPKRGKGGSKSRQSRIELLETRIAAYDDALATPTLKSSYHHNDCGYDATFTVQAFGDAAYGSGTANVTATGPNGQFGMAIAAVTYDHGSQSESVTLWNKDSMYPDGYANVTQSNGSGPEFCNHILSEASLTVNNCPEVSRSYTEEWPVGGCGW